MTNLQEFDKKLRYHDWYYNFSDDGRVWRAGERAQDEIQRISKESPQHLELFESWSKYYFSGEKEMRCSDNIEELNAVRSSLGVI